MQFTLLLVFLLQQSLLTLAWLPHDIDLFSWQVTNSSESANALVEPATGGRANRRTPPKKRTSVPASQKIRGVNLGSLFVMEPWMAPTSWSTMGCGAYAAESECVQGIGQDAANKAFAQHWDSWITRDDLDTMVSYGLNTIRVPIGFWMDEDLVEPDQQPFPQGGFAYLERLCGWAVEMRMYVILDLHGMPGAQKANASFTGVYTDEAGFYQRSQYERATRFLSWLTRQIHSNTNFSTVGMLEVVNEPEPDHASLTATYYPAAVQAIRDAEQSLLIQPGGALEIQFMDRRWGAGDPTRNLSRSSNSTSSGRGGNLAFDNHHYLYSKPGLAATRTAYINATCQAAVSSDSNAQDDTPLVFGEWSLAVSEDGGDEFEPGAPGAREFYKRWWAGQVTTYERHLGWVFWSWKSELEDYRWDYGRAVREGVIPVDPGRAYQMSPCLEG